MLVALDAGHGIGTAGKRSPAGEREWVFNSKVVQSIERRLKELKIDFIRLDDPTGKRDVPLKERTDKANNAKADILVSIHHNALAGRWGKHTGTETYIYTKASAKSKNLAILVQKEAVKVYKLSNRGVKTGNLHMVRESKMPAILFEGGFMDSTIDIVKLRDDKMLKNAGIAIANAIGDFFGVKKPAKPKPPQSETERINRLVAETRAGKYGNGEARKSALGKDYQKVQDIINGKPASTKKTIDQMAKEVIAGKHGNGHANRQKSLGISSAEYAKVRSRVNQLL